MSAIYAKVRSATQGVFLPLTWLPKHFAGRRVEIVLVDDGLDVPAVEAQDEYTDESYAREQMGSDLLDGLMRETR